jgi:polyhydroxyalkanoate synthesis regulator phasin
MHSDRERRDSLSSVTFVTRRRSTWKDTIGILATDEGGTRALAARLVDLGALSQSEARRFLVETKELIEQNRRDLDARIEDSLRRVAERLRVPSPAEVLALAARVKALEDRLELLKHQGTRTRP